MIVGIDPKVDYAFKHLLGREATRPLLVDLLNRVLQPGIPEPIADLELLNPFNPKEELGDKLSILDIKACDRSGRQINVEMQMLAQPFYQKRILYYWSKLHQQQLHEGQGYDALRSTFSISFLDHVLFPGPVEHHLRFALWEEKWSLRFSDDLEIHTLELPKFRKAAPELGEGLDQWLYLLRYAENLDTDKLPETLRSPMMRQALEELRMLGQSQLERERYESRRKAQLDQLTSLKAARLEGKLEGKLEAEREARIRNIFEVQELLNIARTPLEELARLTLEELTQLENDCRAKLRQALGKQSTS